MGASAEEAYSGVFAARFDMAESPAVIARLGGGRRVGSLDNVVATRIRIRERSVRNIPYSAGTWATTEKAFLS